MEPATKSDNSLHSLNRLSFRGAKRRGACFCSQFGIVSALAFWILCNTGISRAQKKPPAEPIDLNTATLEQLERLPQIGPSTAKAIVQFREKSGPFERVEDLLAIHGISKKRLEKLRPYVVVHPPAQKTHSTIGAQPCMESDLRLAASQQFACSEFS